MKFHQLIDHFLNNPKNIIEYEKSVNNFVCLIFYLLLNTS